MTLILDAYNVLHCSHVLPERWAMVDARGLCDLIDRSGFYRGGAAYVVCDGAPKDGGALRQPVGSVELIYAGGGNDADTLIEKLTDADHAPRSLVVVSNDHRVRRAATRRRGKAVSSESFLRGLARALERVGAPPADPEKPTSADEAEVDRWMREFGLTDEPPIDATDLDEKSIDDQTRKWMKEFGFEPEEDG